MQQRSDTSFLISFYLCVMSLMLWPVSSISAQEAQKKLKSQTTKITGKQTVTTPDPQSVTATLPVASGVAPAKNSEVPPQVMREAVATQMAMNRPNTSASEETYRIGPGDLLDIRVFKQEQLSRLARVSTQGTVRLPFAGDVSAACLTESELATVIVDKYKKYINDPQVDVFIKEYQSQPVAVIGAVVKPAQFQLQRRVRLLELLTLAGGPKPDAGHTVHVIHSGVRNLCSLDNGKDATAEPSGSAAEPSGSADGLLLTSFKLSDLLAGGGGANIYIEPGDVISLPIADQVFVTGSVFKPSQVPMTTKITLSQSIAMAGGFMPDAARNKVRLLRQDVTTGARTEKIFNVDDIEKHRAEDIVLQANDVVDVASSTRKTIMRSLLNQIAPTAGTIPLVILRY